MNTLVLRSASRSLGATLLATGARLWARTRFAFRRFGALYAQARMHQAAHEIRRFEACHRPLAERDSGLRSRLAHDARHLSS